MGFTWGLNNPLIHIQAGEGKKTYTPEISIAMFVFGVVIRCVKMFSKERNDDPVSGLIIENLLISFHLWMYYLVSYSRCWMLKLQWFYDYTLEVGRPCFLKPFFSLKASLVFVRLCNQQFEGTILLNGRHGLPGCNTSPEIQQCYDGSYHDLHDE